ncbi:MAG: hypothetical protein ACOYNY_12960 [Caldilineaceae bacterium]
MPVEVCNNAYKVLNDLAIQLNSYIADKRERRGSSTAKGTKLAEAFVPYEVNNDVGEFVGEDDWFTDVDDQSPITHSPNQLF